MISTKVPETSAKPFAGGRQLLPAIAASLIVIAFYALVACTAASETAFGSAKDAYYNRLVDGFLTGNLWLDQEPPAGLVALADPYDPVANLPYRGFMFSTGRVHDLSYFRGKLYLYFSAVPAVTLFLPFRVLTGAYLSHQQACAAFAGMGFLAAAALLVGMWRRCFPLARPWVLACGILGAGFAPLIPLFLNRPDVWEVPIAAAYAFTMGSFLLLWFVLTRHRFKWAYTLGLSATAGLAIGCRTSALGVALLLFVPLVSLVRSKRGVSGSHSPSLLTGLACIVLPIMLIGAALAWYNYCRFADPLEFGQKYQLNEDKTAYADRFGAKYIGYNTFIYFLNPWKLTTDLPFVLEPEPPPMPMGHGSVEHVAGLFSCSPFNLMALILPIGFMALVGESRRLTKLVVAVLATGFVVTVLIVSGYFGACLRYEMEFAPMLSLLACVSILAWEAKNIPRGWFTRAFRGLWVLALAASVAFNGLAAMNLRSYKKTAQGREAFGQGNGAAALEHLKVALSLSPSNAQARNLLGLIYMETGRFDVAAKELAHAVSLSPRSAEYRFYYAVSLMRSGQLEMAAMEFEHALSLNPKFDEARSGLKAVRAALQSESRKRR